jgi:nucleotide-binding universal stress UspA family protein/GNAT superfamily N-acetyltransferase
MPTVRLRDGSRVQLRPVRPEDRKLISDAFDRMSEDSRYRRFFHHMGRLPPSLLDYLTDIDHVDHEAIIGIEPRTGEALGVSRYVRSQEDPEVGEVAFAVVDDWQGRGLGRALVTKLTQRARAEGIRRFVALVQYDNKDAVNLMTGISELERRSLGSEVELVCELPGKRGMGSQLSGVLRAAAAGALSGGHSILVRALASEGPTSIAWRSIRTVVVGTDGSGSAAIAVAAATDIAAAFDATLHLVTAYSARDDRVGALKVLTEAATGLGAIDAQRHARQGHPANVLQEVAEEQEADLIVVGAKGMSGAGRLLGSVPDRVSHRAGRSVLIVQTVQPRHKDEGDAAPSPTRPETLGARSAPQLR